MNKGKKNVRIVLAMVKSRSINWSTGWQNSRWGSDGNEYVSYRIAFWSIPYAARYAAYEISSIQRRNSLLYRHLSGNMFNSICSFPEGTAKPIAETQINIIPNNNNVSLFTLLPFKKTSITYLVNVFRAFKNL